MTEKEKKPAKTKQQFYATLKGIAHDQLGERYGPGMVVDLSNWPSKSVEWLLKKEAITTEIPDQSEGKE